MQKALHGKATLLYAQGSNICRDSVLQADGSFYRSIPRGDDARMKQDALAIAQKADVIVCAMGELQEMSGECASRSDLELFDVQRELLEELLKLNKPLVLLNFAGRPTVMTWEQQHGLQVQRPVMPSVTCCLAISRHQVSSQCRCLRTWDRYLCIIII